MLKFILGLFALIILGLLANDILEIGSFNKSQAYKFLEENRIIENGELFIRQAKKSYNEAIVWAEKNIPLYYNETCFHLKPYLNLALDLSLEFRSNIVSFIQHTKIYLSKNFPVFHEYMSVILEDTVSTAKESAVVISQHLQNYAKTVMQYVNNMFSQR